jgi:hypothetical protein
MKKLLIALALLPFAAGIASASEALTDQQMDKVVAGGFSFLVPCEPLKIVPCEPLKIVPCEVPRVVPCIPGFSPPPPPHGYL